MATLDDSSLKANAADPQDEQAIENLMRFLETRIHSRDLLQEDVHEKRMNDPWCTFQQATGLEQKYKNHFRNILVELEHENTSLKYDNNEHKKLISVLEGRVCKLQNHIDGLLCKLNNACDAVRNIQQELRDRDRQLKQHIVEKQKLIQRCNVKIQAETDRMTQEMEMKLREQYERLTSYIKQKDDKLRLVRQILTSTREDTSDNVTLTSPIASSSRVETAEKATLTTSKEEPFKMTPINHQASRSPCRRIRQTLSSRAETNFHDTRGEATEGPSPLLSKEKPSTVTFVDSQTSGQIRQTSSFHARINSDDIQGKAAKEPILMINKQSSLPSNSKTEIVEEPNSKTPIDIPSSSTIDTTDTTIVSKTKLNIKDKIPVVNPRYQRLQNADRWIDHRPAGLVPTGTILQPQTQPHKRTIRKLTNPKDFMVRSSRYCLYSQEQHTDGELETKLYKADVLPTCGGGAQIVFNDIECLKQISPTAAKRNGQIKLESKPVNT